MTKHNTGLSRTKRREHTKAPIRIKCQKATSGVVRQARKFRIKH